MKSGGISAPELKATLWKPCVSQMIVSPALMVSVPGRKALISPIAPSIHIAPASTFQVRVPSGLMPGGGDRRRRRRPLLGTRAAAEQAQRRSTETEGAEPAGELAAADLAAPVLHHRGPDRLQLHLTGHPWESSLGAECR